MQTVAITVKGKVQGVFFRKYTVDAALKLGVCGYVMNTPEGNVYIAATGSESALKELTAWCHTGSPRSKVESVMVEYLSYRTYDGFVIRYS